MWLLPLFERVSTLATRTYYQISRAGGIVPAAGPVLLVANHPNSLLDPALVASAARRPVRFLAKAPLFTDPAVGWLVRGAGAVPVHRRIDDPAMTQRNDEMFRAVHRALAAGDAVGIFPEGISHSEPSLAPLKTGAARIALGAALLLHGAFPVIPIGLTFREKGRFRSDALVLVGEPVPWDDLAGAGETNADAVHELTHRIEKALRRVTLNLEQWEDAPLVEWAEEIFSAEHEIDPHPDARIARMRGTARALAELRREERLEWRSLARDIRSHARVLRVLGLRPHELHADARVGIAAEWVVRQLAFFALGAPVALVGTVLLWPPYYLTGLAERRARPLEDVRSTYKVLVGAVIFAVWIVLLAALTWRAAGAGAGLAVLLALPLIGIVTLRVHERWNHASGEARRFLLRNSRSEQLLMLRARQRDTAMRLRALWEATRPSATE
jgi:glycerol-3-phosphate O-acyltransferase/dihydroxyacetone phosphate acyltransferase